MGTLTDIQVRNWVKACKAIKGRSDGGGLTFTLSPSGTASWVYRYRVAGSPREFTLGRYPDISLAKARELHLTKRAEVQQGIDVAREKQKAKIALAMAKTLRELAEDYQEKVFPRLAPTTQSQRRYHIDKLILPRLGALPAREISPGDVVTLIEGIGEKSKNVADLAFTALSEIFKHGIGKHVVTSNPCASISVTAILGKTEPRRQRLKLTEEELRTILPILPSIGAENALATKILLATCVRTGELAKAEWRYIDFVRREWLIPDQNSKTRRGFRVPLADGVIEWFRELEVLACGSRFVLPARQQRRLQHYGTEMHYEPRALNSMLHKLCTRLGNKVRRFTPHDLRSTARSHLSALGVDLIVAERCLNHTLGGLIAVYDQHDYLDERRAALERWTSFILACESGKEWKVLPFIRKAA